MTQKKQVLCSLQALFLLFNCQTPDPGLYPKLNLRNTSYVRTHKQTIVNRANLRDEIGDLRSDYEELYLEILEKREAFSNSITQQAL